MDLKKEHEIYDNLENDIYPESFFQQVRKDLEIDIHSIHLAAINIPNLHHRYLSMKKRAEKRLEDAEINLREVEHGISLYYEGRAEASVYKNKPQEFVLDTKAEKERFIKREPAYIKAERIVNLWKRRVDYLEKLVQQINNRSYIIHNAIEFLKFNKGEI